jgi:hypothetical protein
MGKRGPAPKAEADQRRVRVSVYFSADELDLIDQRRGGWSRARYLRDAGLGQLPAKVPPINREAWRDLARTSGLLSQYVAAINVGNARGMPPEIVSELREQVELLRRELLGISDEDEADEV